MDEVQVVKLVELLQIVLLRIYKLVELFLICKHVVYGCFMFSSSSLAGMY